MLMSVPKKAPAEAHAAGAFLISTPGIRLCILSTLKQWARHQHDRTTTPEDRLRALRKYAGATT
ncbi:hypothetical protein Sp245p_28805 (plasmid) [Azospirillum baldaniorum]|uniref:Uncharacterized protein n=1 Tax=Azospirillum baldaniorum TaxID=1064539 RepID=A0A9P1JY85_9PROT|nr:hypothetical protein Sp245p_28805 [Azospirillum baldaniorum]CCD01979.1 protein of unknown function [Azospirillum baldaniorum]